MPPVRLRPLPLALSLSLALSLVACGADAPVLDGASGKADDPNATLPAVVPKRIIWMIGDGMGVGQVTAATYANGEPLAMLSMPRLAFMATHEHEFATTDSAAAASAMASGHKTHFEAVGVFPGTAKDDEEDPDNHFTTVIDVAKVAGWRTGLVATTSLVDATPAAFAAHRNNRRSRNEIARDLSDAGVDVMLGGGLRFFEGRSDGANLLNQLRNRDYSVTKTKTGLARVASRAERAIGLFADKDMPAVVSGDRQVDLKTMTERAIQMLDNNNDDGFFLMVEGSWIDRESHVVNGVGTIAETLDFDRAVAAALAYARGRDDTLVIVTADHETGGLAVLDPTDANERIAAIGGASTADELTKFRSGPGAQPVELHARESGALTPTSSTSTSVATAYGHLSVASRPSFSGPSFLFRATHTATMVALLAEGPGAEFVTEVRDNADLGARVHMLVDADGESDTPATDPPTDDTPENLILIVADGLGLSSLSAATYTQGDLAVTAMSRRGLISTHAADRLVNDAAGSATTLASGVLTARGASGSSDAAALLARAEAAGRQTGLVSSADATDAVVAAFYAARTTTADERADALVDMAGDGIDLVFAGGAASFAADDIDRWEARGVDVETRWRDTPASASTQTVRLVADGALPRVGDRNGSDPSLADMTRTAIASLEARGEPYVLVVYAHGLGDATDNLERTDSVVSEVAEIDAAIAEALLAANRRDDTAVVVTSLGDSSLSVLDNHYGFHKNHCGIAKRCGGDLELVDLPLAIGRIHRGDGFEDAELQGDFTPPGIILQYAWVSQRANADGGLADSGSAQFVPVFASGPGARALEGFKLQTELAATLASWVD